MIGLLAFAGTAHAQSPAAAPTSIPIGDWQLAPALEVRTRGEFRSDSPELAGYGTLRLRSRMRTGSSSERGSVSGRSTAPCAATRASFARR